MAKPILVATFPIYDDTIDKPKLKDKLKKDTDNEYHVLLLFADVSFPNFKIIQLENNATKNKSY
jgi:hypothetical protein